MHIKLLSLWVSTKENNLASSHKHYIQIAMDGEKNLVLEQNKKHQIVEGVFRTFQEGLMSVKIRKRLKPGNFLQFYAKAGFDISYDGMVSSNGHFLLLEDIVQTGKRKPAMKKLHRLFKHLKFEGYELEAIRTNLNLRKQA